MDSFVGAYLCRNSRYTPTEIERQDAATTRCSMLHNFWQHLYLSFIVTVVVAHFRDLFCERFGIPQSKYEKRALRVLLFPHALLVVPLLSRVMPHYWGEDLKFVRHLGDAEDFQEAEATLSEFRGANRWSRNFLRNRCKLRVSGRRAGKLIRDLYRTPEMVPSASELAVRLTSTAQPGENGTNE